MREVKLLVAVIIAAIAGCTLPQQEIRRSDPGRSLLSRGDSVYVALPRDAVYKGKTYRNSGQKTSDVLLSLFSRRGMKAEKASSYQTFEDAKKTARDKAYKYLFYPTILQWEDRKSEWTGKIDEVKVQIDIVDASTDEVLESTILVGKNDMVGSGLERPQALLSKLFSDYVHGLFDVR